MRYLQVVLKIWGSEFWLSGVGVFYGSYLDCFRVPFVICVCFGVMYRYVDLDLVVWRDVLWFPRVSV